MPTQHFFSLEQGKKIGVKNVSRETFFTPIFCFFQCFLYWLL